MFHLLLVYLFYIQAIVHLIAAVVGVFAALLAIASLLYLISVLPGWWKCLVVITTPAVFVLSSYLLLQILAFAADPPEWLGTVLAPVKFIAYFVLQFLLSLPTLRDMIVFIKHILG